MASDQLTLGVLTPYLGGWYYGGLLTGIVRAAAAAGGRVIAVQTLDAGSDQLEVVVPPNPGYRIGLDQVAGYIVIINSVSAEYIAGIRAAGKPVVVISHVYPDLDVPVIVADNATGIREAVTHLIGHGHRRIAFAGYLGADDIAQRHAAYQATLRAHGIEPDPALLYGIDENQQVGGEQAGHAMMKDGLPSTAVVAGTDANAIGIMRVLAEHGHRVPEDQAVIGFDDVEAATYARPQLSTVRQPIDQLGRCAVDILLRNAAGAGLTGRHPVPTSLIVRESCGCASGSSTVDVVTVGRSRGVDVIARASRVDSETLLAPWLAGVRQTLSELAGAGPWALDASTEAVERAVRDLLRSQSRVQHNESNFLLATLAMQYEVSMDLLRGHEEDPRRLEWLARTSSAAGAVGLWRPDDPDPVGSAAGGGDPILDIAGLYVHSGESVQAAIGPSRAGVFPPAELLSRVGDRPDGAVFVVPVKANGSDWGLLAIVDGVDNQVATGREPISQWAALLAAALDHQAMLVALHRQEEQLRAAALYDHLTGLPNRALFLERLDHAITGRRRSGRPFGVLFLDLDGFKVVNDSLGHSAGDRLLVEVAARIRASLRATDTAARFGGDEFLILLDDTELGESPATVAERLQTALAEPFRLDGQDVVVGASIGIALSNQRYDNAEDLLRDADIAMYWAKSQGKGSHATFDVAMHDRAVSRLQTETELRHGLEHHEFELHYQPIVALDSGRVAGFEALVRWRHPGRGLIGPAEFLRVAEDSGLILPMSRWILAEAVRQLADWRARGAPADLSVAVNVSHRQFWQGRLVDAVTSLLDQYGLDPRTLTLEITEGVIMDNLEPALRSLAQLRALGVQIHIDDFGTGYSSLEALHRLPIDALKIDRSFISGLGTDARTTELVRNIVTMGRNLDLAVIAEGIEVAAQRDQLADLKCGYGQGYLFARPAPAAEAERMLRLPTSP